jgi:hypothetical protein
LKINQPFGGTSPLHLQGERINQARNKYEAGSKQSSEDEGDIFFRKVDLL